MTVLSRYDEELIFSCCLGLTRSERATSITMLLAHNEQAADVHARIQAALEPLESLNPEPCPMALAERTIRLLCATAQGVRAAADMRMADSSFRHLQDQRQYSGESDAYDAGKAAIMECSPETTE